MSTELTAKTMTDRVTEKLKAEFVSLITDEEWSSLVKSSYDSFFAPTQGRDSYGRSTKSAPSRFEQIIQTETNAILTEKIRETLNNVTEKTWGDGKETTSLLIEKAIKSSEHVILNSMIDGVALGVSSSISLAISTAINNNQF